MHMSFILFTQLSGLIVMFLWHLVGPSTLLWAEPRRAVLPATRAVLGQQPESCQALEHEWNQPSIKPCCYLIWHCCFPRTNSSWGQGSAGPRNPSLLMVRLLVTIQDVPTVQSRKDSMGQWAEGGPEHGTFSVYQMIWPHCNPRLECFGENLYISTTFNCSNHLYALSRMHFCLLVLDKHKTVIIHLQFNCPHCWANGFKVFK